MLVFEPHYEGSPVVMGQGGAPSSLGSHEMRARVGHHLAPQVLADGRNVFEALGPEHTLLALGGADPALVAGIRAQADAAKVPLRVIADSGPRAREAYGASLILLRPDQFVAWAGDDAPPSILFARLTGQYRGAE